MNVSKALIYGVLSILAIMFALDALNKRLAKNQAMAVLIGQECRESAEYIAKPTMLGLNLEVSCIQNNNRRTEL